MTRAQPLNVADKLDEARALIEKGWCQRSYVGGLRSLGEAMDEIVPGMCFCATGAIGAVTGIYPEEAEAWPYLKPLAKAIGVRSTPGIERWNDRKERTQAEVIEAFKRAADLARAEA